MYLFRIIVCFILLVVSVPACLAAKLTQWKGYLVDQSCRASVAGDQDPLGFVRAQTRECALQPSCRKAGYSLFTDGKWFSLDKNGNKMAENYLLACKRTKSFYMLVEGTLIGNTINVAKLSEQAEPSSQEKQ
jgi:hypothetical protein